jgi:hypothetical protein
MHSEAVGRRASEHRESLILADEENRIIVRNRGGVTTLEYTGVNPDTRYLPRERSVWHQIRESFRMG